VETIGSKRSYALIWCMPNNDDDDDDDDDVCGQGREGQGQGHNGQLAPVC